MFRFPMKDMLQDLLLSHYFDSIDNVLINCDADGNVLKFEPRVDYELSEVMSRKWAQDSFDQIREYDPAKDLFVPLILYADKTGTDRYQRYPLEPWMFTFALFPRKVREKSDAWRHIGFIPPTEDTSEASECDGQDNEEQWRTKSQENLQLYHDYLANLLIDLKQLCASKPEMLVNLGGRTERRRIHLSVAIIVGDQKSQDYVCGRISSNKGAAGRVHRACMCSGVRAGDATKGSCSSLVNVEVTSELNKIALMSLDSLCSSIRESLPGRSSAVAKQRNMIVSHVTRTVRLARALLAKPYTLHPLRNAFDGVCFGANMHGVHLATAEDHLHSTEAGVIQYINDVTYGMMTDKESTAFEEHIRGMFSSIRSSSSHSFPRTKLKKNFTSQSLMTHSEKVGSLLNFRLSMELPECREIWDNALTRQQAKYKKFPNLKTPSSKDDSKHTRKRARDGCNKDTVATTTVSSSAKDFPLRKDLFFASDREKAHPFPRTDASISFLFKNLQRHGFEAILQEDRLDELQLDQLTTEAWDILRSIQCKSSEECYPDPDVVQQVQCDDVKYLLRNCQYDGNEVSPLERNCHHRLRRYKPSHVIGSDVSLPISTICEPLKFAHSINVPNCVRKHLRAKPTVDKGGFTGSILCKTATFVCYLEYLLCYHAWCHYSYLLPKSYQQNFATADFGSMILVQYFDTFVYRGDKTTDSDTCKLHSQLHLRRMLERFGDLMQYNSSTGERGLKDWAKGASRTARKRGIEAFTEDTSKRVSETILLKHISDALQRESKGRPDVTTAENDGCPVTFCRKCPHFRFNRDSIDSIVSVDIQSNRRGLEKQPNNETGTISSTIFAALVSLEPEQDRFEIWCEARLPNGSLLRCFPNYHGNTGPWFDWVYVQFPYIDSDELETYPCKVLALYTDNARRKKALVHSVCTKTASACEGPFKDSKLLTHYRKEFETSGRPMLRSVFVDDIKSCLMTYEAKCSRNSPIPEGIISKNEQYKHTVCVIRRREEWAKLFIDWTTEIQLRRRDVEGNGKYSLI